jgi:hypothetical protein
VKRRKGRTERAGASADAGNLALECGRDFDDRCTLGNEGLQPLIFFFRPRLISGKHGLLASFHLPAADRKPLESPPATQVASNPTRSVTDCNDLNSGNSRCGHDFGTSLSDQEKKALLEYLKTL